MTILSNSAYCSKVYREETESVSLRERPRVLFSCVVFVCLFVSTPTKQTLQSQLKYSIVLGWLLFLAEFCIYT